MTPELKGKWLEALRSGKYKQAKGVLHKFNAGYCCLGVLCDVLGKEWIEPLRVDTGVAGHDHFVKAYGFLVSEGRIERYSLPSVVAEELGIDAGHLDVLVGMNDQGIRFKRIAQYIDDHL